MDKLILVIFLGLLSACADENVSMSGGEDICRRTVIDSVTVFDCQDYEYVIAETEEDMPEVDPEEEPEVVEERPQCRKKKKHKHGDDDDSSSD